MNVFHLFGFPFRPQCRWQAMQDEHFQVVYPFVKLCVHRIPVWDIFVPFTMLVTSPVPSGKWLYVKPEIEPKFSQSVRKWTERCLPIFRDEPQPLESRRKGTKIPLMCGRKSENGNYTLCVSVLTQFPKRIRTSPPQGTLANWIWSEEGQLRVKNLSFHGCKYCE
jgi:hypothetical protein